jgi:hypothetical protein
MSSQAHQVFPAQKLPASASLEQAKLPKPCTPSNTSDQRDQDIAEDPLTPLLNDDGVPLAPNEANSTSKSSSPQKSTFSRLSIDEEKSVYKLLSFNHCQ